MRSHLEDLGIEMEEKIAERKRAVKMMTEATTEQQRRDALVYIEQIDNEWNALMERFAGTMGVM